MLFLTGSINILEKSVCAQDEDIVILTDNVLDIDLIIQTLKEKGVEVKRSMVETAMEYSFEDSVVEGDGIQGEIITFERPSPAVEITGLDAGEDATLTAKTSYYISVLITADEEYISKFPNWKAKTYNLVEKIDDYFIENFGIDFVVTRFEEYYSDNLLSDAHDLFSDVRRKVDKKDANIMIAFNAQYFGWIGGIAELCGDDVIIFSRFLDANVLQHELSHLFNAPDHDPGFFDWCVMSYFWSSFTHSWCDECYYRMKKYIDEELIEHFDPLEVHVVKDLYFPGENVTITARNIVDSVLLLKKWCIEKWVKKSEIIIGWEEIYWSFDFSDGHHDLPIIPIDDSSSIIPYDSFPWESIKIPIINLSDGTVITPFNSSGWEGEDWPYAKPATMLYPYQHISWTWSQITSEKDEAGLGNYRVRIEYDSDYVASESFSIAYYLKFKESPETMGFLDETPEIVLNVTEATLAGIEELSFPDSIHVCDGFLVDFENDGTYDMFQSLLYQKRTDVEQEDNGNYLIDSDADGEWDYIYDTTERKSTVFSEIGGIATSSGRGIPGFEIITMIIAVGLVLFLKRKRRL